MDTEAETGTEAQGLFTQLLAFHTWLRERQKLSAPTAKHYATLVERMLLGEGLPNDPNDHEHASWFAWQRFSTGNDPRPYRRAERRDRVKWPELRQFRDYLYRQDKISRATADAYVRHLRWAIREVMDEEGKWPDDIDARIFALLVRDDVKSYRVRWVTPAWTWFRRFAELQGMPVHSGAPLPVRAFLTRLLDDKMPFAYVRGLKWGHITRHMEVWNLQSGLPRNYHSVVVRSEELKALREWSGYNGPLRHEVVGYPAEDDGDNMFVFSRTNTALTFSEIRMMRMSEAELEEYEKARSPAVSTRPKVDPTSRRLPGAPIADITNY